MRPGQRSRSRAHEGSRYGPRRRLRSPRDFDAVFKRGARLGGRLFLVVALANQRGYDRLGLAVGRRVGDAVDRNRARRLVRESFRRLPRLPGGGVDVVVVGHSELPRCRQAEVDRELQERFRRIRRGPEPGVAGPVAAH